MEPAGGSATQKRKRGPYKKRDLMEVEEKPDAGVRIPNTTVVIPQKEVEKTDEYLEQLRRDLKDWYVNHPNVKLEVPATTANDLKILNDMSEEDLICLKRQTAHYVTSHIDEGLSQKVLTSLGKQLPYLDTEKFNESIKGDQLLNVSVKEMLAQFLGNFPDYGRTIILLGFHIINSIQRAAAAPDTLNNGTAQNANGTDAEATKRIRVGSASTP